MVEQIELRDRQKEFVANSLQSLIKHGNTLGVSPTGSGKNNHVICGDIRAQ